MCEYWVYSCGHTFKTPCKLPKLENQPMRSKLATVPENGTALVTYSLTTAQNRPGFTAPISPSRCCPGFPANPRTTPNKCFPCLSSDEAQKMASMRPSVDRLRLKREGAGNDNWGYSSQGMVGFGQNGNSSWLDQYGSQNGGFGTYLGGGRTMPDKRIGNREMVMQQAPQPNMRILPPGGPQTWPYGPGGTLSTNPSSAGGLPSAGGFSNHSSAVGFGSSASTNVVRSDSDASAGSSGNGSSGGGSFMNPWAVPKSELGHLGVPGGKGGYGNGNGRGDARSLPLPLPRPTGMHALPPRPGPVDATTQDHGFNERQGPRDRYRSV